MKERPILFSAPMVRAILEGRKTQTRRVVKGFALEWLTMQNGFNAKFVALPENHLCPYGAPGDRLWVRETFRFTDVLDQDSPSRVGERCVDAGYRTPWAPLQFEADVRRMNWEHIGTPPHDGPPMPGKLRPAIHMPRWASRIMLDVTAVLVERLQDISIADCISEGIARGGPENPDGIEREEYRALWEQINGPDSWDVNPWVWVVDFKRVGRHSIRAAMEADK